MPEITISYEGAEVLERRVTDFGTGAHIIVPKEHKDKKVKIIIGGDDE